MQVSCPYCGSRNTASILRGMPVWSEELEEQMNAGTIVLGGCMVGDNDPKWHCNKCKKEFGREPVFFHGEQKQVLKNLISISFDIGGFFGGYDQCIVRRGNYGAAICVYHMPSFDEESMFIRGFKDREWDGLLKTLFERYFVHEWKKKYVDHRVLDGTQWSLELTFENGKTYPIYGSNGYPALWNQFERKMNKYFREAKTKESDPADIVRYFYLFQDQTPMNMWYDEHRDVLMHSTQIRPKE